MPSLRTENLLTVVLLFYAASSEATEKRLAMLNLLPLSGMDMNTDASTDVPLLLAEIANRINLIPGYKIELRIADEGIGRLAVRRFFEFERQSLGEDQVKSPIILGPHYSSGCISLGTFLHHWHTVALSPFCTAPQLVDHWKTRNLYLNLPTGQGFSVGRLVFIGKIGGWRRFALISNSASPNDVGMAMFMYQVGQSSDFEIPLFTSVSDVDENVVQAIELSKTRVIVFITGLVPLATRLMCFTHMAGIKGTRYAFIFSYTAFVNPDIYPETVMPGCSRDDLNLLRQAFWFGPMYSHDDKSIVSELNYTQDEFDKMLEEFQIRQNNVSVKTGDYAFRNLFHDNAIMALFALRETELKLRQMNMTLSDYSHSPAIVAAVANNSLLNIEVAGLRVPTGKMFFNKRTGLIGQDFQGLLQWAPETGDIYVLQIYQLPNTQEFLYSSYATKEMRPIKWISRRQMPPNDRPDVRQTMAVLHTSTRIVILVINGFAAMLNLLSMVLTFSIRKANITDVPLIKMMGLFGGLLLNVSCVLLILDSHDNIASRQNNWAASLVCLIVGFSVVNGVSAMRVKWQSLFWALNQDLQGSPFVQINQQTSNVPLHHGLPTSKPWIQGLMGASSVVIFHTARSTLVCRNADIRAMPRRLEPRVSANLNPQSGNQGNSIPRQRKIVVVFPGMRVNQNPTVRPKSPIKSLFIGTLCFVLLNLVVLVVWFSSDPQVCSLEKADEVIYDEDNDINIETYFYNCSSRRFKPASLFPLLLFSIHSVLLLWACYFAYDFSQNLKKFSLLREPKEFGYIIYATLNSIILLTAFSLLLAIISSWEKFSSDDVKIVLSFGTIVTSISGVVGLVFPVGSHFIRS